MPAEKKRIGEILLEQGKIDRHQLKLALERQERWGKRLGETLIDLNFITEESLATTLSQIFKLPYLDLDKVPIDASLVAAVTGEFCHKHHLIPVTVRKLGGKDRVVVATSDPTDWAAMEDLRFRIDKPVAMAISTVSAIERAIRKHGPVAEGRPDEITITGMLKPEDEVMEVVRGGTVENVRLEEKGASTDSRLNALVRVLKSKGVLTEEEARKLTQEGKK